MSLGFRPPPPELDHRHGNLHTRVSGERYGHCKHCTHWQANDGPWIVCGLHQTVIERPALGCDRWCREPGSDDDLAPPDQPHPDAV